MLLGIECKQDSWCMSVVFYFRFQHSRNLIVLSCFRWCRVYEGSLLRSSIEQHEVCFCFIFCKCDVPKFAGWYWSFVIIFCAFLWKICSVHAMLGKCQGNQFPHKYIREISEKLVSFLLYQGIVREIWPFSLTSKNGATYLHHRFSSLYHYLVCEMHMVERSKEYQSLNFSNLLMFFAWPGSLTRGSFGRFSLPIIFLLLNDTYIEICQGKGRTFVREVSGKSIFQVWQIPWLGCIRASFWLLHSCKLLTIGFFDLS